MRRNFRRRQKKAARSLLVQLARKWPARTKTSDGTFCNLTRCYFSVEAALNEFSQRRPPGIYKQDYIDELFKRYSDPRDTPMAPALPDWCDGKFIEGEKTLGKNKPSPTLESEPILDDNEADGGASSSNGASTSKVRLARFSS